MSSGSLKNMPTYLEPEAEDGWKWISFTEKRQILKFDVIDDVIKRHPVFIYIYILTDDFVFAIIAVHVLFLYILFILFQNLPEDVHNIIEWL